MGTPIQMPLRTALPFYGLVVGAAFLLAGMFAPGFAFLTLVGMVIVATGLLVQFMLWDARVHAFQEQARLQGFAFTHEQAQDLLNAATVSASFGTFRVRWHGLGRLELVAA